MVYSTRPFVLCLTLCHFVLVFFSPFSIATTSHGEERANLSAFHIVRFVIVWICRFPLPLSVWEGPRFVTVALPGLFSYLFIIIAPGQRANDDNLGGFFYFLMVCSVCSLESLHEPILMSTHNIQFDYKIRKCL